jgi:FkbM family methyltransferase
LVHLATIGSVNAAERLIDRHVPELAVYLRLLKKRRHRDITLQIIDLLVKPLEIVVDVGAYRGVYTLKMARVVGKGGCVWAIEPVPENVAALRRIWGRRLPWQSFKTVEVLPYGVSDLPKESAFHVPVVDNNAVLSHGSLGHFDVPHRSIPVALRPLDELVPPFTTSVTFMKIDVEGHEHEALLGATRLLEHDKPSIFIEIEQRHRERPVRETFDLLGDYGYTGYFVHRNRLRPLQEFDLELHQPVAMRSFSVGDMPDSYVHDFLFTRSWSDRSIETLLDPS